MFRVDLGRVRSRTGWQSPTLCVEPRVRRPCPGEPGVLLSARAATTNCELAWHSPVLALLLRNAAVAERRWTVGVRFGQGSGSLGRHFSPAKRSGSGRGLLPPLPWRRLLVLVTGSGTATVEAAVTRPMARRLELVERGPCPVRRNAGECGDLDRILVLDTALAPPSPSIPKHQRSIASRTDTSRCKTAAPAYAARTSGRHGRPSPGSTVRFSLPLRALTGPARSGRRRRHVLASR
jgi:hypothetical protein